MGMLVLKWKQPKRHRPVKVHAVLPAVLLVFFIYSLFAPLIGDSKEKVLIGIVVLISGAPFYVLCLVFLAQQEAVQLSLARLTLFIQKLFLCVPETVHGAHSTLNVSSPQRETSSGLNDSDSSRSFKQTNSVPMQNMRSNSSGASRGVPLADDAILEEDEEEAEEETDYKSNHTSNSRSPTFQSSPPQMGDTSNLLQRYKQNGVDSNDSTSVAYR